MYIMNKEWGKKLVAAIAADTVGYLTFPATGVTERFSTRFSLRVRSRLYVCTR